MKRISFVLALSLTLACSSTVSPEPDTPVEPDRSTWAVSTEDEASILAMEDGRYVDEDLVEMFANHPSHHYRERIALALGRIGTIIFDDMDGDGFLDDGEDPAGTAILLELLNDPNPAVVSAAAFALGETEARRSVPQLADLALAVEDSMIDGAARASAIEALAKIGGDEVDRELWEALTAETQPEGLRVTALRYAFRLGEKGLEVASDHLDDSSDAVRRAATYTHSRASNPPARRGLIRLLEDRDPVTRSYAVRALYRMNDDSDLERFSNLMFDPHPWVRTNAVRAVSGILLRAPAPENSELAAKMVRASRDPDPGTKAIAVEALGHFVDNPSARQRLDDLLGAPEWWFRGEAAIALARSGLLEPDQLSTRGMKLSVARAAGPALSEGIRDLLLEDDDPSVVAAAISSIPPDQVEARTEWLTGKLEHADVLVRSAALSKLAENREDPELLSLVNQLQRQWSNEKQNDARLTALGILIEKDLENRGALLEELREDRDPVVRRLAVDAIANTLEKPRPQLIRLPSRLTTADYLAIAKWAREPHTATIRTVRGNIDVALLTLDAPITAWNFAQLAESGYFDDTSFMRVVPNFVIQGGDPRNDMTGGPGYSIRDEINQQHYTRGAVGMALSGPDTGGSQFFITHSPQWHLDGGYTIFGRVIDGMNGAVDQMHLDDAVLGIDIDTIDRDMDEVASSARDPLTLEVGEMDRAALLDRAPGYEARRDDYVPDQDVLSMIAMTAQPGDSVTVVLGTWCRDSQREVPRYLSIIDKLENDYGVEIETRYIAVDRSKQHPSELIEGLDVGSVATFIVYRDGTELGRIVETPRSPLIEDDLLAILAGAEMQ